MISKRKIIILGALIFFSSLAFVVDSKSEDGLKVYFLDIGQGDSVFIETENKIQILIDGGPDNKVIQELSRVMPFWDRTIDFIILTHTDHDHIAGLPEVLKRYEVKAIIETGVQCEKAECRVWEDLKEKEKAIVVLPKLGDSIVFDENTKLLFLSPFESVAGEKVSKANNTSIVAKFVYGEHSILLTGDIEKQIEEKLVLAGINIDSDYLKVPHHGSKTSTTEEFLEKVSPFSAFISVGMKNNYGHPHPEVLERLEKRDIRYYRTDELGNILLNCKLNQSCRVNSKIQMTNDK
ncbi:MAG: competence protein ComEC [Parcubacteria group bacterium Gr01-1014_2]|nr:MAG: competence protein ComEC [Parcubacteria group bacterium Gr01-1014_2]